MLGTWIRPKEVRKISLDIVLGFPLNQITEPLLLKILVDIRDPQLQIVTGFSSYLRSSSVKIELL